MHSSEVYFYADEPLYAMLDDISADIAAYWSQNDTHSDTAAFRIPLVYSA